MENGGLFVNLVLALGAALLGAALAARLGQSAILGYILAGVVIGPFTPGFVADTQTVEALADIGVILLLFTIGVRLSIRDLLQVGAVAIGGGLAQVLILIGVGYAVGLALGWQPLEALFFGAVLSNSSSTVISKVVEEHGQTDADHIRISLAWSTVQDLSTIVLVVVLSALAAGGASLGGDLALALGKSALFLVLLVPIGVRLVPWLFERIADFRSREIFILAVASTALGMAYLASLFGLSLALGAFVAGVIVAESDLSHQILGDALPLRDVLAGLFFVSVGMLVDPAFVLANWPLVLLTLALILVKGMLSGVIAALFRWPIRTAFLAGVLLAQSAEFSFLLARVGSDLGVVPASVFNLMLAGAAASIALAPPLYKLALPVSARLGRGIAERSPPASGEPATQQRGHAVVCGYGGVGRMIGGALSRRGFTYRVIEQDRRVVGQLRAQGIPALRGNAGHRTLLEQAGLDRARVLIVTVPDPLVARQIVDHARAINPRLDIVARAASSDELRFLHSRGVREAVLGEVELALELTRYSLQRFGVSAAEIMLIIQGLRQRGAEAGAEADTPRSGR